MRRLVLCSLALVGSFAIARSAAVSEEPQVTPEMAKKWEEARRPGPHHKALEYFLGTWDGVLEMLMPGAPPPPPEKQAKLQAKGEWLLEGRWMGFRVQGTFMGMPYEGFGTSGFDNTKKKHVGTWVDNSGTTLIHSEGTVVDPTGQVTVLYGTLDEWITGEHDKPIRVTTRKISPDKFTNEIWDLGIGEHGAIVLRYTFSRRK
jgi:hypothetical protein